MRYDVEYEHSFFATTALMGSATVAGADVALSGMGEMGIIGGSTLSDVQFHTDVDVNFSMSGETDSGVSFGASIDLDEVGGGIPANTQVGETVFISGVFGTLTMGSTDGAFDAALTEVALGGSIADDHTSHAGYNGNAGFDGSNDDQVARYDYNFGDFGIHASAEIDDVNWGPGSPGGVNAVVYGIGATYSMEMSGATVGLGLGYQGYENANIWGASLSVSSMGLTGIINYSSSNGSAIVDTTHWGIGVGYTWEDLTVAANYGDFSLAGADNDTSGVGVSATYDLGGGLSLQAGYGWSECEVGANCNGNRDLSYSTMSFGAAMSF